MLISFQLLGFLFSFILLLAIIERQNPSSPMGPSPEKPCPRLTNSQRRHAVRAVGRYILFLSMKGSTNPDKNAILFFIPGQGLSPKISLNARSRVALPVSTTGVHPFSDYLKYYLDCALKAAGNEYGQYASSD